MKISRHFIQANHSETAVSVLANPKLIPFLVVSLTTLMLSGCAKTGISATYIQDQESETDTKPLVERVLTQEEQDNLKPVQVLKILKEGNRRFVNGTLTSRDHSKQVRDAALGQFPKAVMLSCLDSRIPVEDVFDRGIGDIFVARVAGNFENTDILGSLEFACKVSGSKLVFVLGHEHCGAIKGAIDGVELGNITPMLANIRPAVDHFTEYEGEKTSSNEEFVHMVAEQNVRSTIDDIRKHSPILKQMETDGEITIAGGIYDMETGEVSFLDK
jgi:carbonic anhydrase